ncbi:MAG: DUF5050 domain-containing protein [Coriobacteriales bacterium]|nr:DUF5050 domain-containing protein [Coriobacteriales bacterium]
MGDAEAFLGSYKEALREAVADSGWPSELLAVFEPESCLKHSGAKEVYLVTDKRTGGRAILRASDLDASQRADSEHAILATLDFPGIPKTYGTFMQGGRSYLARQYFEGQALDEVIAKAVMQPGQIYAIARQLCTLLGYLHAQQPPVIHRDIKPQNIILCPDGSLGLTDFGIARTFKEGSESDTHYFGTLPYAPPEQYGYAQSSPQTDIYALGIVLIYLATGSPDRRELEKRIHDPQLRSLIEKCIAFDPDDRFKDVGQVLRRIDSFANRRARIIAGAVAGVVLLVILGIGLWWSMGLWGESNEPDDPLLANQAARSGQDDKGELENSPQLGQGEPEKRYSSIEDPKIGSTSWLFDYNYGGNLHANINNGGYAVESDYGDAIYVASSDGLWELNTSGTVLRQISSGKTDGALNAYRDTLYFVGENHTINQLPLDSGTGSAFALVHAERMYFDSGRLYCTDPYDELNIYRVKTDGSEPALVGDLSEAHYLNIVDGRIYYSDAMDGNRIYALDLATGESVLLYDKPAHWLSVCNGRIYFDDDEPGVLASIKLDGTDYRMLYANPCYNINATSHGVFAIDAIARQLVVIDSSGTYEVVVDHEIVDFCVAGGWVFYHESRTDSALRMVREDGTDDHALEW